MKRVLAAVLALGALAASAPAMAQSYYGRDYDDRYERRYDGRDEQRVRPAVSYQYRVQSLDQRIERGYRSGTLTRSEVSRLSAELDGFARLVQAYQRGGLTRGENRELNARYAELNARLGAYHNNGARAYDRRDGGRW